MQASFLQPDYEMASSAVPARMQPIQAKFDDKCVHCASRTVFYCYAINSIWLSALAVPWQAVLTPLVTVVPADPMAAFLLPPPPLPPVPVCDQTGAAPINMAAVVVASSAAVAWCKLEGP